MKRDRAREFLFEPSRFKNDPAVMKMSLPARGAYAILFCEAWDMPEPGVMPDDDSLLAVLARTDPESWLEVRDEVATAFDTTSSPGLWIQRGTVATYEKQQQYFTEQAEHGRKGGLKRASRVATASLKGRSSGIVGVDGVVGVEKEKEKASDSVPLTSLSSPARVPLAAASFAIAPGEEPPRPTAQIEALRQSGQLSRPRPSDENWFDPKP